MLLVVRRVAGSIDLVMALSRAQTAVAATGNLFLPARPTRRRLAIVAGIVTVLGGAYAGYEYTRLHPPAQRRQPREARQ